MTTTRRVCVTMVTVYVLALLVCVQWVTVAAKYCLLKDQCSCSFDDGSGTVDLTSLGNADKTPRFKDVYLDSEATYYSYNPCGPFTEGACDGAAACVLNEDLTQQTQIGNTAATAFKYDYDEDKVIVGYTSGSGVLRLTEVLLICDMSACDPVFEPVGQVSTSGIYKLRLTSICACPNMCTASGPRCCGTEMVSKLSNDMHEIYTMINQRMNSMESKLEDTEKRITDKVTDKITKPIDNKRFSSEFAQLKKDFDKNIETVKEEFNRDIAELIDKNMQ